MTIFLKIDAEMKIKIEIEPDLRTNIVKKSAKVKN